MRDLQATIAKLIHEHDEHMKLAYSRFILGDEVSEMWAYAAGLQHAIRTLEDLVNENG